MKVVLSIALFSLLTIGFFSGFSNFGIPQIEPAAPPAEEVLDLAAMSMDEFVALGERIFAGRGTCTLCHNAIGGRAPLLDEAGARAKERLADARYQGKSQTAEDYLRESMVDPSAFVVAGFGKARTNDTVSPMPNVLSGSIGLREAEIDAVIAYLQVLSGIDITVSIPSDEEIEADDEAAGEAARAPFEDVADAIDWFACGACHIIAGEEGDLGPDLSHIGAARDRAYLRRAILDPDAEIADGFEPEMMPDDFGEQMYAKELEMLVEYLAQQK